jgi:hypothetical protein
MKEEFDSKDYSGQRFECMDKAEKHDAVVGSNAQIDDVFDERLPRLGETGCEQDQPDEHVELRIFGERFQIFDKALHFHPRGNWQEKRAGNSLELAGHCFNSVAPGIPSPHRQVQLNV